MRNEMTHHNSLPKITNSSDLAPSMSASLECTLCFGLSTAVSVYPSEDFEEKIGLYCNGTIMFKEVCEQLASKHEQSLRTVSAPDGAWPMCHTLGLCHSSHRGHFSEYMNESSGYSQALSLPKSLVKGVINDQLKSADKGMK